MKTSIVFFGSDRYSQIVLAALQKNDRFKISQIIDPQQAKPEIGVLASYGHIVPPVILNWPQKGILNLHPSLLPAYRGASPVQTAILNGERQTGLTIIKMDEKVDHGPIVSQFTAAIRPEDTAQALYQRLFTQGAAKLQAILPDYLAGTIKLREQNHSQATYTHRLTRDDGRLDWSKPAASLARQIRAFYPWPGAWTEIGVNQVNRDTELTKRLKILQAHLKNGRLVLDLVQLAGKKPVSGKQFQQGYPQFSAGIF